MNNKISLLIGVICLMGYAFFIYLIIIKDKRKTMAKKTRVSGFFKSRLLFKWILIGGFGGALITVFDQLINNRLMFISLREIVLWFFIGAFGVGATIGGILQDRENNHL